MAKRELEHDRIPMPNGWFAVAFSRDLVPGEVKRIHYFGQELVLFRTRSGQVAVLDAYCAHLGAHLAEGGQRDAPGHLIERLVARVPFEASPIAGRWFDIGDRDDLEAARAAFSRP